MYAGRQPSHPSQLHIRSHRLGIGAKKWLQYELPGPYLHEGIEEVDPKGRVGGGFHLRPVGGHRYSYGHGHGHGIYRAHITIQFI